MKKGSARHASGGTGGACESTSSRFMSISDKLPMKTSEKGVGEACKRAGGELMSIVDKLAQDNTGGGKKSSVCKGAGGELMSMRDKSPSKNAGERGTRGACEKGGEIIDVHAGQAAKVVPGRTL